MRKINSKYEHMKTTHILRPCYLSFKLGHSEQKNNIIMESVFPVTLR